MPEAIPVAKPSSVETIPPPAEPQNDQQRLDSATAALQMDGPEESEDVAEPAPPAEDAPPPPPPAEQPPAAKTEEIADIAAKRLVMQRQRQAQRKPKAPDPVQQKLADILERLAKPPEPPPPAPEPERATLEEISLATLARATGKDPREVYRLLTEEVKTQKPAGLKPAPKSAEQAAIAELRKMVEDERAARAKLEQDLAESGKQWEKQQQEQAYQGIVREFYAAAVSVDVKKSFPHIARNDPSEVAQALAQGAVNSGFKLTRAQLLARLETELKKDAEKYRDLYGSAVKQQTEVPQRQAPPTTETQPRKSGTTQVRVPAHLSKIRFTTGDAEEVQRYQKAFDVLGEISDEG